MISLLLALLSCLISTSLAKTDFLETGNFYFVEFSKYELQETLPPKILLSFDIACNKEFIKVIRNERIEPRTKKTIIALGGLVKENLFSSCAGITKKHSVSAGNAYSGKPYRIVKIKK